MPYPVHGHGRSTKSRRGLAGLGSGERRSLPRPMAAIVAPKPLPFLTFLTTRLPARRSTQTSCSSSAGRRGPAVAATPRPACRVHSRFRSLLPPSAAASPPTAAVGEGMSDPELRLVLELATDEELMEVEEILYGTSYFSPLLKSIARRPNSDGVVVLDDIEERDHFISKLESRFLYLAADARSIIRRWRPSYRDVLLRVRKKIGVRCSSKLCTADLEAEIFLHIVHEYSSHKKDRLSFPWDKQKSPKETSSLGANNWKVLTDVAWRVGRKGMETTFLKGGSALTLKTIYESLASRLSGKLLKEAANYEIKKELVKQGGRLAAVNLESRAGLLAARQGLARAASRYVGLRSVMTFLGPIMWGTLLADIVIQMLGTDYARIVQAIYAFAQIRLTRTSYIEPDEE
ncbi:hypothetical protein BDA96_02G231400 [Sorghum bicolor]|uniref:Uncharacterized protein n=2 Tax=Sorghum bicolor TaxID=4558 RepID=A0A921RPQ6_SORBI|nr:hypothetical protein BDA96_02G231400 [Sorghum bicolor]KXG35742.1 hypothetical protein SORBI_3002G220900 [Sorghum bicolor]